MNFKRSISAITVCAGALASLILTTGCSDGEFPSDGVWTDGGGASGDSSFSERSQAMFFSNPDACVEYEAENIGRTGGSPTSGGWKLTNAGDDINVVRMFDSGAHTFTIVARGTAGAGQKPQMKLTLNGYQIGGNITVTNTARTDGWREYVIPYTVGTGNNKRIKVELANPGSGRALLLDGVSLECP